MGLIFIKGYFFVWKVNGRPKRKSFHMLLCSWCIPQHTQCAMYMVPILAVVLRRVLIHYVSGISANGKLIQCWIPNNYFMTSKIISFPTVSQAGWNGLEGCMWGWKFLTLVLGCHTHTFNPLSRSSIWIQMHGHIQTWLQYRSTCCKHNLIMKERHCVCGAPF